MGSSLGWQHAGVFSRLCARIAGCGRELALRFWSASLRESIEKPLINVLVQGGLAVVGRSPAALYARTPRAWSLVSRACGALRYEAGNEPHTGTLFVDELPPVFRAHPGLLLMWEGGFHGQASYVGRQVTVSLDSHEFTQTGNARFQLRWT